MSQQSRVDQWFSRGHRLKRRMVVVRTHKKKEAEEGKMKGRMETKGRKE